MLGSKVPYFIHFFFSVACSDKNIYFMLDICIYSVKSDKPLIG